MSAAWIPHSRPTVGREEAEACRRVLTSGRLAAGPEAEAFAQELAAHFGRRYVLLTSSGAAALHLALLALGCGEKTRVALPSYVCAAVLNAVRATGAEGVLIDNPFQGFLAEPHGKGLPSGPALVVYPQLFGVVSRLRFPSRVNLIEDCAMALGAGALRQGRLAIASFYATKMMTTGQGGAVFTDERDLFEALRDLSEYDNREDYRPRHNYAMTDLAAAMGRAQLKKLDGFLTRRRELTELYDAEIGRRHPELLAFPGGLERRFPKAAFFRYWVRVGNLEECAAQLRARGIEAKPPVFRPLHRYLGRPDRAFPAAAAAQDSFLSIPCYPSLRDGVARRVAREVCRVARATFIKT